MIVTNQNIDNKMFEEVINIPSTNTLISPILSIIPLQLFSYYIAKEKGLDVKVAVGGAPVNKEFADSIGADGYSEDATGAVALCKGFVGA